MPFKKMERPNLPPRHWILVGYPGSGKSTFATQMHTPLLPIDADHRFSEVVHLAQGDVYELSNNPADSIDPETIYRLLNQNMPGGDVATVVVDSLTTIITPKVVQAVMDNDAGRNRNRMAAFKDKALSMRLLQDAVTMWGTDVLWIYHLQDSRDEQAREVTRATLSATERARLYRSINLELHVVQERNRRGIKVVWSRRGRSGMTLWDDTGKWVGMPEKIEQAVYAGLSVTEQDKIEQEAPAVFPTEEAAIEWAQGQGIFKNLNHARNAFEKLKKANPTLALADLSVLWVEDVEERKGEAPPQAQEPEQGGKEQAPPASSLQGGIEGDPPEAPSDEEPLEERFDFTLFCDRVGNAISFFRLAGESLVGEVAETLKALELTYDPDQEDHLVDVLNVHIQTLPAFKTPKEFLNQVDKDFSLKGTAREKLASLGITGFPKADNGELATKTRRLYWRVKLALSSQAEDEIPL